MPCDGSYMNPNDEEHNRRTAAEFIVFVDSKLGIETPEDIKHAAGHIYGQGVELDDVVAKLCFKLSTLTKKQQSVIIYNGRDKTSRALADWWDEHQEADKERIEQEVKDSKDRVAAIKKLTTRERKLLGVDK
jgi:hypothetical protein